LAIVWEYRQRFIRTFTGLGRDPIANRLFINVAIAFLPLAILGLLFGDVIKQHLFKPIPVAIAFILGAFVILWAERRQTKVTIPTVDDIRPIDALKLGLAQAVALIPGTSRSGATIIGGILFGLSRTAAAEFSFFLAVPTLGIASIYSMYKARDLLSINDLAPWAVGFLFSFISALFVVRALIRYVSNHDFTIFAWYRIIFGLIVLITSYTGWVNWTVH
jgi:undecaprenyl-diphosphatase